MTLVLEQRSIQIREPATGKPIDVLVTSDAERLERTIRLARSYQKQWASESSDSRVRLIKAWRDNLIQHGLEIAALLSQENGKPYHEALLHEVVALSDMLDYIVALAPDLLRAQTLTPRWFKHRAHRVARRPRGVAVVLSPFNFPLLIPGADAGAALAMGCCVIIKPSLACPLTADKLVQLGHAAGIPEPALQIVHGDADVGSALVASDIDEVLFTGSTANGRMVARQCGEDLKSCQLELGGNCPLIVLPDADLDRTARAIMCGAFTNSGQSCLAVGRVLVPSELFQSLSEVLKDSLSCLKQGDPKSRAVDLGAMTTQYQVQRCRNHVLDAEARGGRAISVGKPPSEVGNFFVPTLLQLHDVDSAAFNEETFGPVLPVIAYSGLTDAIDLLNRSRWGLAAYVFGQDQAQAEATANQLDYGHVVVDQVLYTYMCPEVPLAGLRDSGLGVTHGADGLLSHTVPTVVGTRRMRLPSNLEFDWNDPTRAGALAEGILATRSVWNKLRKFKAGSKLSG